MNCTKCGAQITEQAGFCHKCGAPLEELAAGSAASPDAGGQTAGDGFKGAAAQRQGPGAPDQVIWHGSYSPKAMIGSWALSGLVTIAGIVAAFFVQVAFPPIWIIVGAAIAILWLYQFGYLMYRRMAVHYRLTSHWLMHERGVLSRVSDRIEVIDMDDVTVLQGFVERMLGVGSIRITSSDRTHPQIVLPGIDEVRTIANRLDELRRAERMRRGLHIESI